VHQIFKDATVFFSKSETSNITSVIPAMDHFDEILATTLVSRKYSAAIHSAVQSGKATLNRYYSKTDHSEIYRIVMGTRYSYYSFIAYRLISVIIVLDPRYKLEYFRKMKWEEGWIKAARELVEAAFDASYAQPDIGETNEVGDDSQDAEDGILMVRKLISAFCHCAKDVF
jgi:hypothetical protein